MCLACFCACAMRPVGRSVDDIHTNRVGIDLANTWLAALAPIICVSHPPPPTHTHTLAHTHTHTQVVVWGAWQPHWEATTVLVQRSELPRRTHLEAWPNQPPPSPPVDSRLPVVRVCECVCQCVCVYECRSECVGWCV